MRYDAKTAKEEAFTFQVEYVAELGRRQEEVDELKMQPLLQVTSSAARSKELAAVRAELSLCKAEENVLYEALNVNSKKVVDFKVVI